MRLRDCASNASLRRELRLTPLAKACSLSPPSRPHRRRSTATTRGKGGTPATGAPITGGRTLGSRTTTSSRKAILTRCARSSTSTCACCLTTRLAPRCSFWRQIIRSLLVPSTKRRARNSERASVVRPGALVSRSCCKQRADALCCRTPAAPPVALRVQQANVACGLFCFVLFCFVLFCLLKRRARAVDACDRRRAVCPLTPPNARARAALPPARSPPQIQPRGLGVQAPASSAERREFKHVHSIPLDGRPRARAPRCEIEASLYSLVC